MNQDNKISSREQAIKAAGTYYGSGVAAILDAAHQAGHIHYDDEIDAGHDVIDELRAEVERLSAERYLAFEQLAEKAQELADEVERLRTTIRAALDNSSEAPWILREALGDGEEGDD